MLCSLRSDRVVSLSRGKGCIKGAETCPTVIHRLCMPVWKLNKSRATYFYSGVKLSSVNDASIHFFVLCVFQPLHALISAWPVFLALHLEAFWLECYLSVRCGLSKLKQVKWIAQSWSINTGPIIMSCGIKLITFWFKQATQAGWTLAPLQQVYPVRLCFFCGVFFLSPPCVLS